MAAPALDDDDVEADGRSSLGKSRRRKTRQEGLPPAPVRAEDAVDGEPSSVESAPHGSKRRVNFLDEALAAKEKKRRKRTKKKKQEPQLHVVPSDEQAR